MIYRPDLIDRLVTNPRINVYRRVFRTSNDSELFGVYIWNLHVSSVFCPILSLVEVSLRNAIDSALCAELGMFWWSSSKLRYKSFSSEKKSPESVRRLTNNFSNATLQYYRDMRRVNRNANVVPDHNGIVSRTEFSTWEYILNDEFMRHDLIWPKCLGNAFQGEWGTTKARSFLLYISNLVQTVRMFRNRVYHNEAVWKRYGVQSANDAVSHLNEKIAVINALFRHIHPKGLDTCDLDHLFEKARMACSMDEIRRFQKQSAITEISDMEDLFLVIAHVQGQRVVVRANLKGATNSAFEVHPVTI